jgi:hypothetical protein
MCSEATFAGEPRWHCAIQYRYACKYAVFSFIFALQNHNGPCAVLCFHYLVDLAKVAYRLVRYPKYSPPMLAVKLSFTFYP